MMRQNISSWMIPPVHMNDIPSAAKHWLFNRVFINLNHTLLKLSCKTSKWLCLLFSRRPALLFLASPDSIGLQPNPSSLSSDAVRNSIEEHLWGVTRGCLGGRNGADCEAILRSKPRWAGQRKSCPSQCSEIRWSRGVAQDNCVLPSRASLPALLSSVTSGALVDTAGTEEVCLDNRAG